MHPVALSALLGSQQQPHAFFFAFLAGFLAEDLPVLEAVGGAAAVGAGGPWAAGPARAATPTGHGLLPGADGAGHNVQVVVPGGA